MFWRHPPPPIAHYHAPLSGSSRRKAPKTTSAVFKTAHGGRRVAFFLSPSLPSPPTRSFTVDAPPPLLHFSNCTGLAPLSTMIRPICRSLSQMGKTARNNHTARSSTAAPRPPLNVARTVHAKGERWSCVFIVHFVCFNNKQLLLLLLQPDAFKRSPRSLRSRNSAARRSTWMLQTPSILVALSSFSFENKQTESGKQPAVERASAQSRRGCVCLCATSTGLDTRALPSQAPAHARTFWYRYAGFSDVINQ